ncbi:N-acetylneuraminate lyase B-like [Anopheles nili]|uniref:N-acetylneuraminate lyase B-like n=1 Tax=Anopheles nili TaxID=185578 RepID=UPI00237BE383|nr:N-acetylneuraminate lyase B-like [Anopheles nili]
MNNFNFTGLMAPVFTPYFEQNGKVNIDVIESYVQLLVANKVRGILVNGTTGEGMLLSTAERMLVTEVWHEACKKHAITMMVQIGGAPYPDVVQLAKHASKIGVDAVLCLPELYFKPKTSEQLVRYLKGIAAHCRTTPFFYYHIPMFTDVNIFMPSFMDMAEKEIDNFRGIKYTNGNLEEGSACLKEGRIVFLGADTILCAGIAAGFESFILTTINIYPETLHEIIEAMNHGGKLTEARAKQQTLNKTIASILSSYGGDWVPAMKKAFTKRFPSIEIGQTRPPLNM